MSSTLAGSPPCATACGAAGTDIEPDEVSVSFYGDLFRHDPESEEAPDEVARAGVADMLHETLGDDMLATLSQAAGKATFERTVDLVGTLMTKPDLQLEVQRRVAEAVRPDTRIIVAHSLGTFVTYNALVAHPEWEIDTFVTLGSPLGCIDARADDGPPRRGRRPVAGPARSSTGSTSPPSATTPAPNPGSRPSSVTASSTAWSTTATGPTTRSPT